MITSEITEEKDEEDPYSINSQVQKEKIRNIIQYQKSLYWSSSSSSSFSSAAASCSSSISSSRRSCSLLQLMKTGNTSLRRLFDMEHTSLSTHFQDYSGSPVLKTIPLWGSDTDGEMEDPWAAIKQQKMQSSAVFNDFDMKSKIGFASDGSFSKDKDIRKTRHRLTRKKSFRKLPGFGLLTNRGFRLRLKRLRIMICGRIF